MGASAHQDTFRKRMSEALRFLEEEILAKIPEPFAGPIREQVRQLKELVVEARPPRFAIVGRRGAGKSSLINAIFGAPVAEVGAVRATTPFGKWYHYRGPLGEMQVLDTRGLGEGKAPDGASEHTATEQVTAEVRKQCPDALLFLCKAKEVDARIDHDVKALRDILASIQALHSYDAPVVGVVTQVDELDPPHVAEPPFDDPRKQENIRSAVDAMQQKLPPCAGPDGEPLVLPVCAYVEFSDSKITYDRRWNIDKLGETLLERLPDSAQMAFARIARVRNVQRKLAQRVVSITAALAGATGATPIPVADMPVITGMQIGMITAIAYIAGRKVDKEGAREFLVAMGVNVGAGFALREAARALVKVAFPGLGNAVSGGVAAAGTYAIGRAAIAYFIDEVGEEGDE